MSEGKGQQVMEHNSFPLEFQLPDGKDIFQTATDTIAAGFSVAVPHQSILYGTW